MKSVPLVEQEIKLFLAWQQMAKEVGGMNGMFDDAVHDRYASACNKTWGKVIPRFSYESWIQQLPARSGMRMHVRPAYDSYMNKTAVPVIMLARARLCSEEGSLVWIARALNLPVMDSDDSSNNPPRCLTSTFI
jgi:hypothetical protein